MKTYLETDGVPNSFNELTLGIGMYRSVPLPDPIGIVYKSLRNGRKVPPMQHCVSVNVRRKVKCSHTD